MVNALVEKNKVGGYIYDLEDVEKKLNDGMTQKEIASLYGVSQASISGFIKKNGLRATRKKVDERLEQGIILYKSGFSALDAAYECGVNYMSLTKLIKSRGIGRGRGRSPKRSVPKVNYPYAKEADRMLKDCKEGYYVCPMCGKMFYAPGEWAYRVRKTANKVYKVCTYSCSNKGKQLEEQVSRV